jgi:hypothetical protein
VGREGCARLVREERGQALVESALVLPLMLLLVFGVVMSGRLVQAQLAVQAAAREAGRSLAAAPSRSDGLADAEARAREVLTGRGLDVERFDLALDAGAFERGGTVAATARYRVPLGDLPLLGHVELTLSSGHEERVELHRSRTAATP